MNRSIPKIEILRDAEQVAECAAARIIAKLRDRGDTRLGFATGATMAPVYARLVAAYCAGEVSFRSAVGFNLDEYVGLAKDSPRSFRAYMRRHLFEFVDISRDRVYIPDGTASDIRAESLRYEKLIQAAGGIDLQLLGIGVNGHIGFNEPGSGFASRTRGIKLDEATRAANAANFPDEMAPKCAITVGIATILEARQILLLATGAEKAAAIVAAVEGPLTPICPASVLRLHSDVHIFCDEAAASALTHRPRGHARRMA
jgi:glucosamine-6-phosphate deaminase